MLDISTGHLTYKTCNGFLKNDDCPICAYEFEYGWIVPVPDLDDDPETRFLPIDLENCLRFAVKNKCDYIKFDCDGIEYDELTKYDW